MSRDGCFFIVCERDCESPFDSEGAIILEQYVNRKQGEREDILPRAKKFADSGRYGRVWIGIINYADLEEIPAEPKGDPMGFVPARQVDDSVEVKRLKDLCMELGIRARMAPHDVLKLIDVGRLTSTLSST